MAEFRKKRKKVCHMCAGKPVNYKDVNIIFKHIFTPTFISVNLIVSLKTMHSKYTPFQHDVLHLDSDHND